MLYIVRKVMGSLINFAMSKCKKKELVSNAKLSRKITARLTSCGVPWRFSYSSAIVRRDCKDYTTAAEVLLLLALARINSLQGQEDLDSVERCFFSKDLVW